MRARPCGLNFHRLGLPLIFIRAYPRPQRVRFTDCGAKVFPVLGSATSTEVLQPLQCLGRSHVATLCNMLQDYGNTDNPHWSVSPVQSHLCNSCLTGATKLDGNSSLSVTIPVPLTVHYATFLQACKQTNTQSS